MKLRVCTCLQCFDAVGWATCIWPSWCHCHSLSLASVKSRLVLPFWYQLIRVVLEKGPLIGCVCVCACEWRLLPMRLWVCACIVLSISCHLLIISCCVLSAGCGGKALCRTLNKRGQHRDSIFHFTIICPWNTCLVFSVVRKVYLSLKDVNFVVKFVFLALEVNG